MDQMERNRPIVIAISGFSSNVGKTTLVCELLNRLPGWEAIKLTRGHYRSCGKDPQGCCVSDLLRDEPLIRSGRDGNYQVGKDTARFWDAGATNVHWVIVKDDQVESGIKQALSTVKSVGVIVEGNSFLDYIKPDIAVMCARSDGGTVKQSARNALTKADILYISSLNGDDRTARKEFEEWQSALNIDLDLNGRTIFTHKDLSRLISRIIRKTNPKAGLFHTNPDSEVRPHDHRIN